MTLKHYEVITAALKFIVNQRQYEMMRMVTTTQLCHYNAKAAVFQ